MRSSLFHFIRRDTHEEAVQGQPRMEPEGHHVESLNCFPGFIRAPVVVAQHLKEKDAGGGGLSESV